MDKFLISDFCFIRTPAFSLNLLQSLLDKSYANKFAFSQQLRDIYSDSQIITALHASTSPELFAEFTKWLNNEMLSEEKKDRMEETLIKYLVRMTTRCVPFALFSGFNLADTANTTSLILGGKNSGTTHMRLDMEYLQDILDVLNNDTKIKDFIKYYPNNSLYPANDKYKYIEYSTDTYIRKYNYAAVYPDDYVNLVLDTARGGATILQIITAIQKFDHEISEEESKDFVNQLISSQILISELQPFITGPDNLEKIIELLERSEDIFKIYLDDLRKVKKIINQKKYSIDASTKIKSLVESITGPKKHWSTLQLDLEIELKNNQIASVILDTITSQIQELSIFAYGIDRPALREFISDFQKRYDLQEIPLVLALDPEEGIGYGNLGTQDSNDLITNIPFLQEPIDDPIQVKTNYLTQFITDKYIECINKKSVKIELTEKDITHLRNQGLSKELPDSFFIHGSLLSESTRELDIGNFRFQLKNLSGPPSCLTLSRFCYASEKLTKKIKETILIEEKLYPNAIVAEIVHLSDARVGNVTIRPNFRKYEIEYLGKSGLDRQYIIPITDIMVSVRNGKAILRSKTLNKQIIPRLTNAHVFPNSYLPLYKFFGEAQRQGGNDWLSWHWQYLQDQKFLPRVEYKNIILKTAKWRIYKEDMPSNYVQMTDSELVSFFSSFSKVLSIPRYVSFFEELDKEFVLDLHNVISCKILLKKLEKNEKVLLEEYLLFNNNWLHNAEGASFAHEIMFPVNKSTDQDQLQINNNFKNISTSIKRTFTIGSEWLYVKLYSSHNNAEIILKDHLSKIISSLIENEKVLKWHFIRYSDPDYHLRIRLKMKSGLDDCSKTISLVSSMLKTLLEKKLIYKAQVDTYEREVERYGYHTIQDSESIFSIDSEACLAFIKILGQYNEVDERWLWCLKAIDLTMTAFNLDIGEKQKLMAALEKYEFNRCHGNNTTRKAINAKLKINQGKIKNILTDNLHDYRDNELLLEGLSVLEKRTKKIQPLAKLILEKVSLYNECTLFDLISSYIHMFINRLFTSLPNRCECVIYTLLNRYYSSQLHKKSK